MNDTGLKKELPIRFIDAGKVPYLRSQTIYHAVAYALTPDSPDTVILSQPGSPYVCVGFHQDVEQEVDVDYCRAQGIPIIRRETGGGTVFIDEDQLFVQWIFHPDHLPRKIDNRFQLFIQPQTETYQFFEIPATLFPPNDVHVKGKKIVGTGAAAIGQAEVVTGNFLLDFDIEQMAHVLQTPNAAFQTLFQESMGRYMTTMKKELGQAPELEQLKAVYAQKCAATLKRALVPGEFSDAELAWMEKLDRKFSTDDWLFQYRLPPKPERTVKVHAGVYIGERYHSASDRQIRATIRTRGPLIDKISFSGDFSFQPESKLDGLERALHNVALEEESLKEVVDAFFELHEVESPGLSTDDWIKAILRMKS